MKREANEILRAIGHRIRLRREWQQMDQRSLSKLCGVSWQMISYYENGLCELKARTLLKLARGLNTTVGRFFGEEPSDTPDDLAAFLCDPVVAKIFSLVRDMSPQQRVLACRLVATSAERDAA